jgi:hypothetical protein
MIQNRNATAAHSRTPYLRDHRMRQGEKIRIFETIGDFAHNFGLEPAGLAGGLAQGRQLVPKNAQSTRDRCGFVLRSAPGERSHPELSPRQNGLPTTITGEERFAAGIRFRGSHRAWRDKRRTPLPRPVPGPGRRSG